MRRVGLMMLMTAMGLPGLAAAENAWIRIEAKRGNQAEAALAGWREKFDDVQSFSLPNGMTGIALGPLDAAAAAARMAQLKAAGTIPADSYLTAPGGIAPLPGAALAAQSGAQTPPAPPAADAPVASGTHIQLQATPGRISADQALAYWRARFPEAGLWRLPGGLFAVALAPQSPEDAARRLAQLKSDGRVPGDTYLATTAQLGAVLEAPRPEAAPAADTAPAAEDQPADQPSASEANPAAASTAGLTTVSPPAEAPAAPPAPAVMPPIDQIQGALRWAGFYDGPVDGKSGPGTRAAIDKEIAASDQPDQPAAEAMIALIARREAWRAEMGLTRLDDAASGLGLMAPMDRLAFDRVERGLSIYGPKDGSGAALILFRQPGGQQEMLDFAGLVTALGWVPQPERTVSRGAVRLVGQNDQHRGAAEARVVDDQVEGWVLIWPQADAQNATRLAAEASESFSRNAAPATAPADTPPAE